MSEELPDILSFKRTGRSTAIVFDDLASELLATQLKIVPFFRTLDSIKRILKDMYDDYEPLAKKVYEVIKKHFMIIDIRKPFDNPLSIRFR
ncbi:20550_t:CDS:2 [Cetraspora pellucida]|uniref:20550_t:CDS:1 n=1 Tax=Cetraspora pellucida TaxID=1433469 RepID=A0A9N9DX27_9GLOM|nr:20550_t:CDS:2 [Cetraspora pellucida]